MKEYPLVSTVIPTFNRKRSLERTLQSLKLMDFPKNKIEIIVVDNGSTDNTSEMILRDFPEVILIKKTTNIGVPAALNAAIKISHGKFIFQTNDDVIFERNCLRELVKTIISQQDIGIAGGKLYFSDRPTTSMISSLNLNLYIGYHSFHPYKSDCPSEVDIVTGACMLIKKRVIDKIGPIDEMFGPYGAEDYEYCFRAKAAGFKVIYCPQAIVWVEEFKSNDKTIIQERLFGHYKGKFRFMLIYASLIQNLIFFPLQIFFGPFFCYIQSRKKVTLPILNALWWNIRNLKNTLQSRKKINRLKQLQFRKI